MRKNHHFYTLSTFYTKLKSHTNRKSDTICSFAPHNVCQSLPKPKKQKKTKNKKTHPNPPDLLHPMGLFFFVFFGFLEVFATFGGKPQENKKKQKKKQKNTPQPPRSSPSHGFVFFVFFWFSRGFCNFWWKALRKPKNTCITLYKLFNCSNLFQVFISCFSIHYFCLIYPFNHLMTWSGRWPPGAFNLIYLYNLRKTQRLECMHIGSTFGSVRYGDNI